MPPEPGAARKTRCGRLALFGASARLANLPSVLSNVWLGLALAGSVVPPPRETIGLSPVFLALAAVCCYLGGNLLNDWHDRQWDARHRPERALPQGAFTPASYLTSGLILIGAGWVLATLAGPGAATVAGMLALAILAYTRWHKTHPGAVFIMGLCRGLLPLLALGGVLATACIEQDRELLALCLAPAMALGFHTCGLSLLARGEADATTRTDPVAPLLWPALAALLLVGVAVWLGAHPMAVAAGAVPYLAWTSLAIIRHRRNGGAVAALLAGFPLLDWVLLLPFGLALITHAGSSSYAWISLLLPPSCFVAGLILQRLWKPS